LLANRVIQLMHAKFYSRSHDAVIRVYEWGGQRDPDTQAHRRFQRSWRGCANPKI